MTTVAVVVVVVVGGGGERRGGEVTFEAFWKRVIKFVGKKEKRQ